MDANPLNEYLREISRMPLLSDDQQRVLAGRIAAGGSDGKAAKRQMIEANLRLVVSVAREYKASGVPMLALIQEGNIVLMRATDRFDADDELRFSTFATGLIRQAIDAALEGDAGNEPYEP